MNNNNGLGCFGNAIVILLVLFFFAGNIALFSGDMEDMGLAVVVAVIADSAIAIWILTVIGKAVGSSYEKRHEKNITERKELIVKEIGNKISHRSEIQHAFYKHFEKIERQSSLVALISSCMGTNNQELNNLLINKKDEAFEGTKIAIFHKLTEAEKKRFPQNIAEVEDYEKTLEQEISELKTELNSVSASDDERISTMLQKHCPEVHKSIKRKKRKLIAAIVIPTTIVITLSIALSSGLALNLAKDYHRTVLENKLIENEISSCSISTIEYEEHYKYSFAEDDVTTYDIKDITLRYDNDFSTFSEKEIEAILRQLYRNLNVNITYRWAQHKLSFETDEYYYNIILIDKNNKRCSYDGDYFDIDK